jgi:hypothetical protein
LDKAKFTRIVILLGIGILVLELVPFILISFYNHPAADDYICAIPALQWDPITNTIAWYLSWSSRYTSAFLVSTNALAYKSLLGYKLSSIGLILSIFIGFNFLCKSVFKNIFWGSSQIIALFLTCGYISCLPSVVEGLYYFNGAICYLPGNVFLTLLISWWFFKIPISNLSDINISNFTVFSIQSFLLFLIAGNNEVIMMISLSIVFLLWFRFYILNKKNHFGLSGLLTISFLSTCLVLFSPSTYYRIKSTNSVEKNHLKIIVNTVNGCLENTHDWLSETPFMLLIISFAFIPVSSRIKKFNRTELLLFSVLSIILYVLSFLPSYFGEGVLQGRTANTNLFILLLFMMINILFWKKYYEDTHLLSFKYSLTIKKMYFLIVCCSFLVSNNSILCYKDLKTGDASKYNEERNNRIKLVETALGDSVWVPSIKHKPKTIFFSDIGIYPEPWYDNFYAQYHGKKFISLINKKP